VNRLTPILSAMIVALACLATERALAQQEDHPDFPPRFAVPEAAQSANSDSSAYAVNIMDQNKLGLTLSNYGFIGTNFTSRAPSFEYPLGSGLQHMVRGGIWVGGVTYDDQGDFTGVSTAAQDGSAGSAAAGATEYTPATAIVYRRSTLPNSRYFKDGAISELDFISRFSDRPAKHKTGYAEDHRPLGIIVTQYNFSWSFSDYANINFFHYVIKNDGPPLENAYVAMYAELASGNMNASSTLPPPGWFSKKQIAWIDSLNLFVENYCLNSPAPTNCFYSTVPDLAGFKLLGIKPGAITDPGKKVTLQCWSYSPGSPARDEDVEKYALMGTGTKAAVPPQSDSKEQLPDSLAPKTGDPVELLAVGPFTTINSGDSVSVDFAYIGAPLVTDSLGVIRYNNIIRFAQTAQRAYDLNYVVPVPPPSPKFKVVVRDHAVDYYWDRSPEFFIDKTTYSTRSDFEGYRLYIGEARGSLHRIAQFDSAGTFPNDTVGYNTGFSAIRLATPVEIDGRTYNYKYTVDHLRDGFKYWAAVTAYDLGTSQIESLESGEDQNEVMFVPAPAPSEVKGGVSVFPNPYRVETAWDSGQQAREHFLWFTNLPSRCTLKIYTLSGALIYETEFDGATYNGSNARGIYQPANDLPSNLSGTTFGWDMVTREGQAAATGLYMWAIEDKQTGKHQRGKFLLVKSDRESF
jgi:hypothetical protein